MKFSEMTLSELVQRSLQRLKKLDELFIKRGYKPLVLFSGGKDSLVVLDLVHQVFGSDLYVCYVHIPGNTHEECDYYVLCTVEKYLGSLRRFYYLYREDPVNIRGVERESQTSSSTVEPMVFRCLWSTDGVCASSRLKS